MIILDNLEREPASRYGTHEIFGSSGNRSYFIDVNNWYHTSTLGLNIGKARTSDFTCELFHASGYEWFSYVFAREVLANAGINSPLWAFLEVCRDLQ